ncbi:MAG TPA: BlaI/MecI/CopY family transcriptional regulator [Polyangiaceae bacterium]|nr:BlaI/MecI/CopY family transcriptional regulator [Polyangiaceae bacterium]
MPRPTLPTLPTDAELAILGVLWRRGPSTVREVHDALSPTQGTGYTTVLKLMQLMAQKGLVIRDESQRSHVYRPASAEAQTQRRLIGDLMDKAFSGSAAQLVMRALSVKPASKGELEEIRHLLDELAAKERK